MFDSNYSEILLFYCLTPLHAGAGQGLGAVDNPIQRERHTNWPMVQASGVKGSLRDHFERALWMQKHAHLDVKEARKQIVALSRQLFGKALDDPPEIDQAGAVALTDARLLLFPVRSSVAPFVWITCHAVLERFRAAAALAGVVLPELMAPPQADEYLILCDPKGVFKDHEVLLEDLVVKKITHPAKDIENWLMKKLPACSRVMAISDQYFNTLVETATEVQPQIAILFDTGTTKDGSLRYQELLPADSVLYALAFFTRERKENGIETQKIMDQFRHFIQGHIQLGGDWSLGRGICHLTRVIGGGAQ